MQTNAAAQSTGATMPAAFSTRATVLCMSPRLLYRVTPPPAPLAYPPSPPYEQRVHVNRLTNSRALAATSRQPASIVSVCPRSGILTISVTPLLRFCFS